jgi:hypothetical protein
MKLEILEGQPIVELDELSRSLGNTPLLPGLALASVMRDKDESIIGFASVQSALHASGSWIHPEHRKMGYTYQLRYMLESEMRIKGVRMYFSFPQNDFERKLFAKYGPVKEEMAQVKEL